MKSPQKILVIRFGAMGDLVHVASALQAVRRAISDSPLDISSGNSLSFKPDIELHWLTAPIYRDMAQSFTTLKTIPEVHSFGQQTEAFPLSSQQPIPLINQVFTYDKRSGLWGLLCLAMELRRQSYTGVVNLQPSFRTALLSFLLTPCPVVVYRKEKLRVFGQAQRQQEGLQKGRLHAALNFFLPFTRLLSLPIPENLSQQLPPSLTALPTTEIHWQKVLGLPTDVEELGVAGSVPTPQSIMNRPPRIALIPGVGAKRGNRAWPLAQYQTLLLRLLSETEAVIVLIGGAEEAFSLQQISAHEDFRPYLRIPSSNDRISRLEAVSDSSARLMNAVNRLSISQTTHCLAEVDVVVGGDTGPLHLASTTQTPIISLFGPTAYQRTGPLGPPSLRKFLLPDNSLDCWPCELPSCPLPAEQNLACLWGIEVQTVFDAIQQALATGKRQ